MGRGALPALETLDASDNRIQDAAAAATAAATGCSSLADVRLAGNPACEDDRCAA